MMSTQYSGLAIAFPKYILKVPADPGNEPRGVVIVLHSIITLLALLSLSVPWDWALIVPLLNFPATFLLCGG